MPDKLACNKMDESLPDLIEVSESTNNEWKSEETSQDMQNAEEADIREGLLAQPKRSVAGEEDLICKALVKEIGRTPTWLGVVEAWQSLLRVRRMARGLQEEHDYHLENCGDGVENKKERQ